MWQLFLERFIPVMEDDVSYLDVRDGVGSTLAARAAGPESVGVTRAADSAVLSA